LAQPTASGQYVISGTNWSASPWNKYPIVSELVVEDEDLRASTIEKQSFVSHDSEDVESSIISLLSNHISRWEPKETLVALGLDSLDMLQLVRDISNTFDVDVGLQDVMSSDKALDDLICLVAEEMKKKGTLQ
jgi:acyl carrier protein